MNAITSLRSNGTQTGAREITKDIDEQPKKLSDGEAVAERTNQTHARKQLTTNYRRRAEKERTMCYVIYTGVGREKTALNMIAKLVPHDLYVRVFYPFRHMRKKIGGNWADIYEWLIPGYLFVITDTIAGFYTALRRVPRLTKLLGKSGDNASPDFFPISPDEETWLRAILGDNWFDPSVPVPASIDSAAPAASDDPSAAVAALSMIDFDENDNVRILSGPLMSFVGNVRRLDLHHRRADVEVNFMGRPQLLRLGFEILSKDK